jgi:peptidoglycan/LPS O-acetylase OafA/YrhL
MKSRNQILDLFKGIAIIAVILYHAGLFTYGYLGVEMFLVIGGYLITKSIIHTYERGHFSYWDYLSKRLVRLWPLALLITVVSLAGGYFTMLPDAFKNTCETAVGTSTFTNNFIQYITAGNYWDTANECKPLMHTWYLGVIFQFYVFYPFVFMLCHRFAKNYVKVSRITLMLVFVCSLLFFILPGTDKAVTFYLLPTRLYEFAAGGMIALSSMNHTEKRNNQRGMATFLFFAVVLLCINDAYNMAKVRLLLTVALSVLIILYSENFTYSASPSLGHKALFLFVPFGVASYSLYLWHQVVLAFYRYVINSELTLLSYVLTIGLSLVVGYLSYLWIEKGITSFTKNNKPHTYIVLALCLLVTGATIAFSFKYYKTQGVVRDIPELEVYVNDPSSWSPQEYNARITTLYEKPFPPRNGKKNVLVIGDSYARDWINVLLESNIDSINIVYSEKVAADLRNKITQADIIFVVNNGPIDQYVNYLPAMMEKKFYRVGHKFFGYGVGSVYNRVRMTGDYKHPVSCKVDKIEEMEKLAFQGRYIDIMQAFRYDDGTINLFTPDRKLITHDGIHLTKAGAILLSKRLPEMKSYFE